LIITRYDLELLDVVVETYEVNKEGNSIFLVSVNASFCELYLVIDLRAASKNSSLSRKRAMTIVNLIREGDSSILGCALEFILASQWRR